MANRIPGRKPVHLKPAKGRTTGRGAVWAAIRKLKSFTVLDLEGETAQPTNTIKTYVAGLTLAGYLEKEGERKTAYLDTSYKATVYKLIKDVGVDAPRVTKKGAEVTQGRKRENMWRTIKVIKDFNFEELAAHASTEEDPVAPTDARDYIKYLYKAGYLARTVKAKPGNKPGTGTKARYKFLSSKNSGPLAPMVQRIRQVYDPNLGEVVWSPDPEARQ